MFPRITTTTHTCETTLKEEKKKNRENEGRQGTTREAHEYLSEGNNYK